MLLTCSLPIETFSTPSRQCFANVVAVLPGIASSGMLAMCSETNSGMRRVRRGLPALPSTADGGCVVVAMSLHAGRHLFRLQPVRVDGLFAATCALQGTWPGSAATSHVPRFGGATPPSLDRLVVSFEVVGVIGRIMDSLARRAVGSCRWACVSDSLNWHQWRHEYEARFSMGSRHGLAGA